MFYFFPDLPIMFPKVFVGSILIGILLFVYIPPSFAQEINETSDPVSLFNAAQDLHEKGDLVGAIKLYGKAIKLEPDFPEAEYQCGIANLALGNSIEAEKSFRRAVELRTDWTLAMASLGSLLVQKDALEEAERILNKILDLDPLNQPALSALTELRLRKESPSDMLKELLAKIRQLTAKANPTVSLITSQAALENALGDNGSAKTSLVKALNTDPQNRPALFLLSDIAIFEGDIEKARDILNRLEKSSNDSDSIKYLRANVLAFERKFDDANLHLRSIQSSMPRATELQRRIKTAQTTSPAELEKFLSENPKDPAILGRLCGLYRKEDPQKALEYCRRAAESEPNNVNHAVGFGAALVQAKQYESAVNILRRIIDIVPDNATSHANLATALFQLKRFPEAKAEFRWLTKMQPKSAGPYLLLGIIHDHLDEYLDSLANYQQYLQLADPVENKLDIEKVNLRLPSIQKLIKDGKAKRNE